MNQATDRITNDDFQWASVLESEVGNALVEVSDPEHLQWTIINCLLREKGFRITRVERKQ